MPVEWLLYMCQLNSPVTGPYVLCKETSHADPDQNQKDWLISGAQKYKDWNRLKQIPIPAVTPLSPSGPHLHTYPSNLCNICPWMQKLILALQMTKTPGDVMLLYCSMIPHPLDLPLVVTAELIRRTILSAKPLTSTDVMPVLPAAPGRCWRGSPWNHVTFSKSSMTQEDGNAQSNVLDTPKGVT